MSNILTIDEVSKAYGQHVALDKASFEVDRCSVFALLGPNGAGKTTLLRIINSILLPDSGTVSIDGHKAELGVTTRMLGYMPEERGLYPKMSVEEQILYFGILKGCDKANLHRNMREYMDLFQMPKEVLRRRVEELSKGNQQKVQVISTIVHEPQLVILDEPFSGFDPLNGRLLTDVIHRLRERECTVLLSSHNMNAVEEMASHIALINQGKVVLNGELKAIKEANRSGLLSITTDKPIDIKVAAEAPAIQQITPTEEQNSYLINPAEGVSNAAIISDIARQADILRFNVVMPTLTELFLKYTTQS